MTMNIAIIYSPNWSRYAAIETFAAFKSNPTTPVKVHLVTDREGFFDASKIVRNFGEGYSVEFIDASGLYKEKKTNSKNVTTRFTHYTLYRLLIPQLIKEDRVLYLDADAIVNGNLEEFYNMNMENYYVAAAEDIGAERYGLKTPIGIKKNEPYVNAGVLLMNLKKIREDGIYDKWLYEMNANSYTANDQCLINKVCKGRIKVVSPEYNCSVSTTLDIKNYKKEQIKIMHFAGGTKPWDDNMVSHARIWFDWSRDYRNTIERGN